MTSETQRSCWMDVLEFGLKTISLNILLLDVQTMVTRNKFLEPGKWQNRAQTSAQGLLGLIK